MELELTDARERAEWRAYRCQAYGFLRWVGAGGKWHSPDLTVLSVRSGRWTDTAAVTQSGGKCWWWESVSWGASGELLPSMFPEEVDAERGVRAALGREQSPQVVNTS